ncbi:U3 small nucleolar RNA-associated protein 6-domain-containing protein [Cantharellus anzutake]|uniref:U3 small nucleolar RNA-associated protein 6-domain-containing protein n=1 Tax=Cantharellus anzutake TaxID=1750568 RepID=UPI001903C6E0|nr:U3 small nucleolar RNA-associated protein 6-domain-containing protein [Cantharellus anzutake]KAF8335990.1 U3 small nucleolar RNA-associated protein 6-domain-containing protein [Cantharellus anzutake]
MDIAHLNQERTLPIIKLWIEKGVLSREEVKMIVKRREKFEAALLGTIQRKTDYLKYVEYEMTLNELIQKRIKRQNSQQREGSIPYRVYKIFERGIRKFQSDLGIWVQYIQAAKRFRADTRVTSICARAMQLHPTSPALFILSSSEEVSRGSYSAARTLLQRGLRLNPESTELWTEYVKMEMNHTEVLREVHEEREQEEEEGEEAAAPESAESVKVILDGGIVKTVMDQAMKDVKNLSIFHNLQALITSHPTPLRPPLLKTLYDQLIDRHPSSPEALVLYASRHLDTIDSNTPEFVDGLRNANEELLSGAKKLNEEACETGNYSRGREMMDAYARWVENRVANLKIDDLVSDHSFPCPPPQVLTTTFLIPDVGYAQPLRVSTYNHRHSFSFSFFSFPNNLRNDTSSSRWYL